MKRLLAAALCAVSFGASAEAATIQLLSVPALSAAVANPVATSTTGQVRQNVTRDWPRFDNPWTPRDAPVHDPNALPTAFFTGIAANSTATYALGPSTGASFVWGTIDYHNKVEFLLGGVVVDSFNFVRRVSPIARPLRTGGALAVFSDITGGIFDGIRFSSGGDTFEIANLSVTPAPVPLPAGAVLLLSAIGGMALTRRRQKAA